MPSLKVPSLKAQAGSILHCIPGTERTHGASQSYPQGALCPRQPNPEVSVHPALALRFVALLPALLPWSFQAAGEAPEPCLSPQGGAEGLRGPTLPAAAPPGPAARSSGRDKSSVSPMRQRSCETSRTICTVFSGNPLSFPYSCCSKKLLHDIPSRAAQAITELGKRRQNPEDALTAHSTRLMVYPPTDLHHSSSAAPEDE